MTRFDFLIAVMASTLLLPLVVSAQTMPVRGSDLAE